MRVRLKHEQLSELVQTGGISQNHWAMRLGVSRGHFSDLVRGKYPYPSRRTQTRLLEVFDVEFEDLFVIESDREDWSVGSRAEFQAAIADRYLVDEEIGHGGMGTVYLARDIKHGRRVAIKVISPEVVSGIGAAQFLREIRRTASLDHHHILTLIDSGAAAGYPYYVMPFVSAGSLRARLERHGRLLLEQVVVVTRGVAAALQHAHAHHVVHCDIKPENILFSEDHAYVADFGIARTIHAEARAWARAGELDSSAGTPAYVSPEQALGDTHVDQRADVYSLGCVIFEMLTGAPPFTGTTTMQVVSRRFTEGVPDVREYARDITPAVSAVVRRAMDLRPDQRFASVRDLVVSLERAAASRSTLHQALSRMTHAAVRINTLFGRKPRRRLRMFEIVGQQLAYAVRSLRRSPGFALAATVTLGLGIGSNATMLEILDRLLLRPPPHVEHPENVKRLYLSRQFLSRPSVSASLTWPDIEDLQANSGFTSVAGMFPTRLTMGRGEEARQARVTMVTPSFFPLLGVRPLIGRFPLPDENTPAGVSSVAVLTYGAWTRWYSADERVLGRVITLGSGTYTIIGVTPPGFSGVDLRPVDLFVPIRSAAGENIGGPWETSRGISWVRAIARVQDGEHVAAAEEAASIRYRDANRDRRSFDPGARILTGPLMEALGPRASNDSKVARWLAGVSAIVLLIACANVANLLLARSVLRRRETAIRRALGISRMRLFGHLVTESLVLAAVGGAAAMLLARWAGNAIRAMLLPNLEWSSNLFDLRLLGMTVFIVVISGLAAGVGPALIGSRSDVAQALKGGAREGGHRRSAVQTALTVTQTALSVVLLVGAGLFLASLRNVRSRDVGFDLERVAVVTVDQTPEFGASELQQLFASAAPRLRSLPGVTGVGLSNSIPFLTNWAVSLTVPGIDSLPVASSGGPYIIGGSQEYFDAMGLRVLRGRGFGTADRAGSPLVTIVSETMARLVWQGADPLGRCLKIGGAEAPCATVIGVMQDVTQQDLVNSETMVYYALLEQYPDQVEAGAMFVRADNPAALLGTIRETLTAETPTPPYVEVQRLEDLAAPQVRPWKLGATMFTIFGVLALVVAAVGVYGIVAFDVNQRTHELGVRTALGATSGRLMTEVIVDTLRVVVASIAIGVGVAIVAARPIKPLLFGVATVHPPTYVIVVVVLVASAVAASAHPAWRATRVEPIEALRVE